jgi:CheY-like chemotaxis protein
LKIDIAFIRDVTTNPDDAAIVQAIITMAHSLNLVVIAEGVETPGQLGYLRRHQCDQVQGYHFSRPLPAGLATDLLAQRIIAPLPAVAGARTQTMLAIDDDPLMLDLIADVFEGKGYHLILTQSASAAFEALAQNDVQVILCDQNMPEMTGTEFLDRVKIMYPATFRIILSGKGDLEEMMAAVNRGAIDRFYTKPWDNDILVSNVQQAFQQQRTLPGAATPTQFRLQTAPTAL